MKMKEKSAQKVTFPVAEEETAGRRGRRDIGTQLGVLFVLSLPSHSISTLQKPKPSPHEDGGWQAKCQNWGRGDGKKPLQSAPFGMKWWRGRGESDVALLKGGGHWLGIGPKAVDDPMKRKEGRGKEGIERAFPSRVPLRGC